MKMIINNLGIFFILLLTIFFTGLKLVGGIDWSWSIVLFPIWASILVATIIFFTFAIFYCIRKKNRL